MRPEFGITPSVPDEPIIEYLKRKLREAGPGRWGPIATVCGVGRTLPRKIVYGDRENPGVVTIQPLIWFFEAVDRGERELPAPDGRTPPLFKHSVLIGATEGKGP